MQIKTDFTREELMGHDDVLSEASHPIKKLKAISNLLYAYPDGPFEMTQSTIMSVSDMITDATEEIELLIKTSNEQRQRDRNEWKAQATVKDTNSVDTLVVELAPVQWDALDKMVDLTGKSDDSLAQLMFDHGFESWDSLARLMNR